MRTQLAAKSLLPTRTALFIGGPGQGKTLAARWISRQMGVPLHIVNLASVVSSYLGRTGSNLQQLMAASASVPCVLLLDEIDCLAKRRGDMGDVGEMGRLVTVILQQLDGWPDNSLLIGATNHADILDPAVWRRFEMTVQFPAPQESHLSELATRLLGKDDIQSAGSGLAAIVAAHVGGSYSDFTTAIERALRTAIVTKSDFEKTLLQAAAERIGDQPNKSSRKQVAAALRGSGMTEREVREVTGLSRDLIRKLPGGRHRA